MKEMKVIRNGETIERSYEAVCHDLGIDPKVHFVEITTRHTISFTLGKPQEICYLLWTCEKSGYKPSQKLIQAARR